MDGNTPKVSIIVPVYNVRMYLEQCLDSIINQTLQEIEIIVIDDGSTDGSGQICDGYAQKDTRIIVIHKQNQGLSAARNDGLNIARAEYVMFVDSDDWVEPDFCNIPYQVAIERGSDLVVFQRVWHRNDIIECQPSFPVDGVDVSKKDILTELWSTVGVVAWNKLYRWSLFDDVRFPVGRLSEDVAVTHRLIHKAKNIHLLNQPLYHHRSKRLGSIMDERSANQVSDEASLNVLRYRDLREWGYIDKSEEVKHALYYLARMGEEAELSEYCQKIVDDRRIGIEVSWKWRLMYRLYRVSPRMFDLVSIITRVRYRSR